MHCDFQSCELAMRECNVRVFVGNLEQLPSNESLISKKGGGIRGVGQWVEWASTNKFVEAPLIGPT